MSRVLKFSIIVMPLGLFASSAEPNYDVVERTLNFLLFFSILLYFIAKPLKDMHLNRIRSIASKLENIQEKLRLSQSKKQEAIKRVEEAKINAANLIETAKKEAVILAQKKDAQNEISNLEKSFKEQKEFQERKMIKNATKELLNELFDDKNLKIDQKELINIILKKVS